MDNAIILGGNAMNIGIVNYLHSINLNVVVVDYRENISLDNDLHIVHDGKDPQLPYILKQQGIDNIKIVYTSMDNAGLAQRAICREYGLLYAPEEAMINAHYKNKMHEVWKKADLLNRESFALPEFDLEKIKNLNSKFKIIIKPANACASRGITILDKASCDEDLKNAFNYALENSTNDFVNIEEFVEGTEYMVDMVGDDFGNVSVFGVSKKYHSKYAPKNKVAVKMHYNAKDVSDELKQKIANYAMQCYKSIGLKNTFGHLEIMLKKDGTLSPVEIGARSSGFIGCPINDVITDVSYIGTFIKALNGEKIQNGLLKNNDKSVVLYYYDFPNGSKAKSETNIMNYINKEIKSLYYGRENLTKGAEYKNLTQDTDRYGFEILTGPKDILTIEEVNRAEEEFLKDFLE